eukprot:818887-Amorphochlora_amoeboformis.AAC.1
MPKSVLASRSKTRKSKKMRESIGKAGDGVRPSLRIESRREKRWVGCSYAEGRGVVQINTNH